MKFRELKSMQSEELNNKLAELRKDLMKDNAQVALGAAVKNSGKLKMIKKNVARIHTLLREREGKESGGKQ